MTETEKVKIFKAIDDYVSQQKLSDCSLNEYYHVKEFSTVVKRLIDELQLVDNERIGIDVSSKL